MKKLLLGAGAFLFLAGCAGPRYIGGGIAYDGYYDDHYGQIYDGYWGDGDAFYYRAHPHGHYIRDTGGHFRHDTNGVTGFHPMHVTGPAPRSGRPHH